MCAGAGVPLVGATAVFWGALSQVLPTIAQQLAG
jgi:hypothetical protein